MFTNPNKTKIAILVSIVLVGLAGFIGWKIFFAKTLYGVNGKPLGDVIRFTDVYNKKASDIVKLRIRNGSTGEIRETTDQAKIEEFLKIVNSIEFTKDKDQGLKMGWTYYVDLFESNNDKIWFRIGFTRVYFSRFTQLGAVKVSPYYGMNNYEEIRKKLDDYYNSLKVG